MVLVAVAAIFLFFTSSVNNGFSIDWRLCGFNRVFIAFTLRCWMQNNIYFSQPPPGHYFVHNENGKIVNFIIFVRFLTPVCRCNYCPIFINTFYNILMQFCKKMLITLHRFFPMQAHIYLYTLVERIIIAENYFSI